MLKVFSWAPTIDFCHNLSTSFCTLYFIFEEDRAVTGKEYTHKPPACSHPTHPHAIYGAKAF